MPPCAPVKMRQASGKSTTSKNAYAVLLEESSVLKQKEKKERALERKQKKEADLVKASLENLGDLKTSTGVCISADQAAAALSVLNHTTSWADISDDDDEDDESDGFDDPRMIKTEDENNLDAFLSSSDEEEEEEESANEDEDDVVEVNKVEDREQDNRNIAGNSCRQQGKIVSVYVSVI